MSVLFLMSYDTSGDRPVLDTVGGCTSCWRKGGKPSSSAKESVLGFLFSDLFLIPELLLCCLIF